ncbi:MAG: DUF2155 domain-containing protein [Rhodobacteraceae bacterium]|nr:DUF2155 domain-containing protein [Paracoccaceae bacterium]
MIRTIAGAIAAFIFLMGGATAQEEVSPGIGALLRGLDKVSGEAVDLPIGTGETIALGWLQITLGECRFPSGNPAGDAFAWLVIRERNQEVPVFEGWMIASSPALSALDHSRFDIWVIRCTTE